MGMAYSRHTGPRDRALRASDADREAAAEMLRREHVAGRLDDVELDARLAACFAAVTYADLDRLVADLPDERTPRRARRAHLLPYWPLPPLLPLFVVAVIASHGHALWLLVPLTILAFVRGVGPFGLACGPWARRRST
jgi:Domain of unknown function (DUF1707)